MNKHLFTIIVFFLSAPVFLSCIPEEDIPNVCLLPNDTISTADTLSNDTLSTDSHSTDSHSTDSHSTDTGVVVSVRIEKFMDQNSAGYSVQGAAIYGDYMFQLQDNNYHVFIYNLKDRTFHSFVKMDGNSNNHCNNASFSRVFYSEEDRFPLLYVSGSSIGTYNQVQVYRIVYEDDKFSVKKVQEIVLPQATNENCMYWTGVVIDNDNNYMYVYANHHGAQIYKFAIPEIDNELVVLSDENIIDRFTLDSFKHQQGATCMNNMLYVMDGIPAAGDIVYLRIIDLKKHKDDVIIDLTSYGFEMEPEGVDFYEGQILCATNKKNGIYTINIEYAHGREK